ncbi:MAG TPA: HAMP domain-containing sensor histidine kinase [Nitrososphaeraceae archaeon]
MNASHSSSSVPESAKKTEAYYGVENVVNTELQFFSNAKRRIDACMNFTIPSLGTRTEQIKKSFMNAKNRGVKIRYLTEITKDNIEYCKEMMENVDELKHLEGIMSNFVLSESEYLAPVFIADVERIAPEIIYCNINSFVEQQQYFFDVLWNKAETAEQKFREIEAKQEADFIEIIRDPNKVLKLAFDLIVEAKEEILVIFSTENAFHRQTRAGAIKLVIEATCRGVKASILTPFDERVRRFVEELEGQYDSWNTSLDNKNYRDDNKNEHPGRLNSVTKLKIRPIEPQLQTKISILIVDRKYSLAVELKDDSKDTSDKAMGLASYSNSKSTVSSYVSIFQSLWRQLDVYEQLKEANKQQQILIEQLRIHDNLQQEFINTAAHELRTPIQPILGLTDILSSKKGDIEQYQEYISIINRNARRLKLLTEDILDVAKIEAKSLELKNDTFDLVAAINSLLDDYRKDHDSLVKKYKILFECKFKSVFVYGDRNRISQVVNNLLDNAIKYSKHGLIIISLSKITQNTKKWIISVKDDGQGIDSQILPRLFTKFTTKSEHGIGLGLFISKSIVEAHGGRIWAENNVDGKGATFSFSLPTSK